VRKRRFDETLSPSLGATPMIPNRARGRSFFTPLPRS
jgi:hypothetical protein